MEESQGYCQSQLGNKLRLRVEVLAEHTEPGRHKGWKLLTIEAHTITKMAALLDRLRREWFEAATNAIDPNQTGHQRPALD
jgi:hypothetical protein